MELTEQIVAYVHAVERRERNGKWRVRGIEVLPQREPVTQDATLFRYKYLTQAVGENTEAAESAALQRFFTDASCRPYVVYAIRNT